MERCTREKMYVNNLRLKQTLQIFQLIDTFENVKQKMNTHMRARVLLRWVRKKVTSLCCDHCLFRSKSIRPTLSSNNYSNIAYASTYTHAVNTQERGLMYVVHARCINKRGIIRLYRQSYLQLIHFPEYITCLCGFII